MGTSIIDAARELSQRRITVELATMLPDGKPAAVKLRAFRNMDWFGADRSIPLPSGAGRSDPLSFQETIEWLEWQRRIVAVAIVEVRDVTPVSAMPVQDITDADQDSGFAERWRPMSIVKANPDAAKYEMTIEEFDFADNVSRCATALINDSQKFGFGGLAEHNFRSE